MQNSIGDGVSIRFNRIGIMFLAFIELMMGYKMMPNHMNNNAAFQISTLPYSL